MTSLNAASIIEQLQALAHPDQLAGMARFGLNPDNRLGVKIPDLRKCAKTTGKNHQLALDLWKTGIADARILASMIDDAGHLSETQMEEWVKDFNSWDVCDQVCMNLFDRSPLAWKKIHDWSQRPEEFVKRAAYTLIACLAWHDKKAANEKFTAFFPLLTAAAVDERNYVKKAVNWALRHIGKRNLELNRAAIACAADIQRIDSKAARWIAADALRELQGEAVQQRLQAAG